MSVVLVMCKRHPDRPAVMRGDGQSTGLCEECRRDNFVRMVEGRKTERKRKKEHPEELAGDSVTISFAHHPEILANLKKWANREFRSVENQILFYLSTAGKVKGED